MAELIVGNYFPISISSVILCVLVKSVSMDREERTRLDMNNESMWLENLGKVGAYKLITIDSLK